MWMLVIAVFTGVSAIAALLSGGLAPATAQVGARVADLEGSSRPTSTKGSPLRRVSRLLDPWVRGKAFTRSLDRSLYQVGWAWAPSEFMLACGLLGLAAGAVAGLVFQNLLVGAVALSVGALTPVMQLRQRRAKTLKAMNDQLPDALMLVVNGLKAGNSFLQALMIVSKQMNGAIAQEFGTTVSEINWGLSVEQALTNMSERIGTVDIELVVSAMLVQRESGGNLSEILQALHDTIRDRVRIAGEVQALTAQGRMSAWVLSCLPAGVGLLFFLVSPSYILGLFTDPRGHMLVAGGIVSQALGIYFIRRVIDIRY